MHVEFAHCLSLALEDWIQKNPLQLDQARLKSVREKLGFPETEDCPRGIVGTLSSPVALAFSALLKSELSVHIAPQVLANEIYQFWSESKVVEKVSSFEVWFPQCPVTTGFVNVDVTSNFKEYFLQKILEQPPEDFLSNASYCFLNAHVSSKPRSNQISWEPIVERASQASIDTDMGRLLESSKRSGHWTARSRMMLLAMLGNPELEVSDFLSGLKSTQNIPWFLEKFFSDQKAICDDCDAKSLKDLPIIRLFEVSDSVTQTSVALSKFAHVFFHFRRRWQLGISIERPEISFSALLALIQEFYRVYHHPKIRTILSQERGHEVFVFQALTSFLNHLSFAALSQLQFQDS